MRYGTSVKLSLKQASQTSHYIWRTQSDGCVRESHAKYNGKVFAWDNPPATGHPGEDFNCRCIAEPYTPAIHETLNLVMTGISDSAQVWEDNLRGDFVDHYWNGNGEPVRLRDTGHLRRVVNEYWRQVKTDLLGQIANAARDKAGNSFIYDFGTTYRMQHIVFDLGRTTIGGIAKGRSSFEKSGTLRLSGRCEFYQRDMFEDPIDMGVELQGSKVYEIYDDWQGVFQGRVLYDRKLSKYRYDAKEKVGNSSRLFGR